MSSNNNLENTATPYKVIVAIIAYSICSSTLLLANKVAISYIARPAFISVLQIAFANVALLVMKTSGAVKVDDLVWTKVKPYLLYMFAFVLSIFANMKALQASNVETVIVFRACAPLMTTIIEYLFMGRLLPSTKSTLSLLAVSSGAIMYCMSDSQLQLNGIGSYGWVLLYYALISFEMTYGKSLTSNVKMDTVWGPVLYTNLLGLAPMCVIAAWSGDFEGPYDDIFDMTLPAACVLLFSCFCGLMIGLCGWHCRGLLSATTFTLVGVVNKFGTILLNVLMWDKHSSPTGIVAVCICLCAGVFYEQAPRRETGSPPPIEDEKDSMPLIPTKSNDRYKDLESSQQSTSKARSNA